jgi:hypothetical protein
MVPLVGLMANYGWADDTADQLARAISALTPSTAEPASPVNPSTMVPTNGKLKIFILAGQSNMQGHGKVDLGADPNGGNVNVIGGLGLRAMVNKNPRKYADLLDKKNGFVIRPTPVTRPIETGPRVKTFGYRTGMLLQSVSRWKKEQARWVSVLVSEMNSLRAI